MKKVILLLKLVLIISMVFSILLMAESSSQAKNENITIKLGHIWATEHPLHKAAIKLSEEIEEATNGAIKIEVFPASQLGNETEQWEAVSTGLQQMTIGGSGFKWDSRFTLLDIPYAIKDLDHLKKIWNSDIGSELTQSLVDKANIRILGNWYYGTRRLTTTNKIVRTPEDMKGFKLRIPNLEAHRVGWTQIGASPTPIAFSETYLALRQGVVDGQENPIASIGAMKFYEVQKYLILTNHVTQALNVVINEQFYQDLSKEHQELLENMVTKIADYEEQLQYEVQKEWLEIFKESGMEFIEPDRAAFRKAGEKTGEIFTEKYKWGDLWIRIKALSD